jgi:hypothetical protein
MGQHIYAYTVGREFLKAASDKILPKGARLAILTTRPAPKTKLKQLNARFVYSGTGMAETSPRPIDVEAFRPDARSRALLRGVTLAEEDLRASGGAYDLAEVRRLMHGMSRQAIDKRVRNGSLLAVTGPSNRRSYPTVQFLGDGSVVGGLKEVRAALSTKNPWMVLNFLVNPEPRLNGRKPIELLRSGKIEPVIDVARRQGTQGA